MAEAVQLKLDEIKLALEYNSEFFIQFFMEDDLEFPVPQFHIDIFTLMVCIEIIKFVCAIPRGHAKTTLAKLACVWYFLFSDYRFIVYVSKTSTLSVAACNDIVGFLESQNFIVVFGPVEWLVRQEGAGFYKFKIGDKLCILKAQGAGMQVRGLNIDNQRPELAVVDDMEDNDNIATEDLFKGLKRWFYGNFKKAMARKHKIIWLGNMISYQSILREICESSVWHSRRYGCLLSDGKPLWNDLWPIEALQADFIEYQEAGMTDIWFAEMMNLPIAAGRGLIDADDITYRPAVNPGEPVYGFMTIDLAISAETWAHETVICCHGWMEDLGLWQIVEYRGFYGIDPIELFEEMLDLAFKWRFYIVGIENVAYQASLKFVWRHECLQRGLPVLQEGVIGANGFAFKPLQAVGRKVQRLAPWAALLKSANYALTEGDFVMTEELLAFDPQKKNNKDNNIDAAAYGPQMMDLYSDLIVNQNVILTQNARLQTIYDIAEV